MAKYGKKNHISLNVTDVSTILLGQPKVGKTTIFKEIAEKEVGEQYMFFEFYHENGSRYIENIIAEDIPDWEHFEEVVSDIEENPGDYDLKVVYWDTLDGAITIAEQESLRLWNKECRTKGQADKCTDSINAAWGGFQHGQDKAMELLDDMKFRLEAVGIKVQLIGHIKTTNIIDPVTNETYTQLTSDVTQKYFNHFKKMYDLIAVAYIDRDVVAEKTGRKNVVTHKDETRNVVKSETRKIKFRDPMFAIDSGGRLREIVDEIDFGADEFIEAVKNALTTAVEKAGVDLKDRAKEDKANDKAKAKEIADNIASNKVKKELETVISSIVDKCKEDKTLAKSVVAKCKELGFANPKEIDDCEIAKEILAMCE